MNWAIRSFIRRWELGSSSEHKNRACSLQARSLARRLQSKQASAIIGIRIYLEEGGGQGQPRQKGREPARVSPRPHPGGAGCHSRSEIRAGGRWPPLENNPDRIPRGTSNF